MRTAPCIAEDMVPGIATGSVAQGMIPNVGASIAPCTASGTVPDTVLGVALNTALNTASSGRVL